MSRYLDRKDNGSYLESIESMDICKWRINEVCCNAGSQYIGDFPFPYCLCDSKEECLCFEKEDGKIRK